jgi:hypothetical protein
VHAACSFVPEGGSSAFSRSAIVSGIVGRENSPECHCNLHFRMCSVVRCLSLKPVEVSPL